MQGWVGKIVCAVAVLAMAFGVMMRCPAQAQGKVVYINSSGGVVDDVNRKVFWDPFTAATGIKVVSSAPVDNAKLQAMVMSGNVEWDITEIDDGDFLRAIKHHLLAKLDLSMLPVADLAKDAVNDYGVWDSPYSTVLTWNTNVFPMSGKHPTSLMDLWNQEDFPGPRCLWKDAQDNLELGVLHASVSFMQEYHATRSIRLMKTKPIRSSTNSRRMLAYGGLPARSPYRPSSIVIASWELLGRVAPMS